MTCKPKHSIDAQVKIVRESYRGRPAYRAVVGSLKTEHKVYTAGDDKSRRQARRAASNAGKQLSRLSRGVQDRQD